MVYVLFPLMLGGLASLALLPFGGVVTPALGLLIYPFVLIVLPLVDKGIPLLNAPSARLRRRWVHDLALAMVLPLVAGVLMTGLWQLGQGHFTVTDAIAMGLAIGMVSGAIGMTAAHEMIHRDKIIWRGIGVVVLTLVQYGHFRIEHIYGHHINVGTPADPATARKGEGFYRFFLRVLITSYRSAWGIERRRLTNRKQAVVGPGNRMFHYLALQALVIFVAWVLAGGLGLVLLAVQTLVALTLTEAVDYIQHYGLMRKPDARGRPEPVAAHHSWNSRHAAGDWTTFNIGLHSHHHGNARTPYPELHQDEEQHEMPGNYAVMIMMALVPPIWFRVMDKRLPA